MVDFNTFICIKIIIQYKLFQIISHFTFVRKIRLRSFTRLKYLLYVVTMEYKNTPIILKTLVQNKKYPYFFKNENIDKNIYIVQRAYTTTNALYIIDVWNTERYNIGEIDKYIDIDMPYNKYLYNGNNNITKVEVNGGDDDFKVLLYKKDGIVNVVALLKF